MPSKIEQITQLKIIKQQQKIAVLANNIWDQCIKDPDIVSQHPYIIRKLIQPYGIGIAKQNLIIPVTDITGKIWSIQYIDANGNKFFLKGGRKRGCGYTIGSIKDASKIYVCEGFATAATVYELMHIPTIVAFDAYNLSPLIGSIRKTFPNINIIIAGDNDHAKN